MNIESSRRIRCWTFIFFKRSTHPTSSFLLTSLPASFPSLYPMSVFCIRRPSSVLWYYCPPVSGLPRSAFRNPNSPLCPLSLACLLYSVFCILYSVFPSSKALLKSRHFGMLLKRSAPLPPFRNSIFLVRYSIFVFQLPILLPQASSFLAFQPELVTYSRVISPFLFSVGASSRLR